MAEEEYFPDSITPLLWAICSPQSPCDMLVGLVYLDAAFPCWACLLQLPGNDIPQDAGSKGLWQSSKKAKEWSLRPSEAHIMGDSDAGGTVAMRTAVLWRLLARNLERSLRNFEKNTVSSADKEEPYATWVSLPENHMDGYCSAGEPAAPCHQSWCWLWG